MPYLQATGEKKFEIEGKPLKRLEPGKDYLGRAEIYVARFSPAGGGLGPTLCISNEPEGQLPHWMAEYDYSGRLIKFNDRESLRGKPMQMLIETEGEGIRMGAKTYHRGGLEKLGIPVDGKTKSMGIEDARRFFERLKKGKLELPEEIRGYFEMPPFKEKLSEMKMSPEDWEAIRNRIAYRDGGGYKEICVLNSLEFAYRVAGSYEGIKKAKELEPDAKRIALFHPDAAPRFAQWEVKYRMKGAKALGV